MENCGRTNSTEGTDDTDGTDGLDRERRKWFSLPRHATHFWRWGWGLGWDVMVWAGLSGTIWLRTWCFSPNNDATNEKHAADEKFQRSTRPSRNSVHSAQSECDSHLNIYCVFLCFQAASTLLLVPALLRPRRTWLCAQTHQNTTGWERAGRESSSVTSQVYTRSF